MNKGLSRAEDRIVPLRQSVSVARCGFTLVEMAIVIVIIALLLSSITYFANIENSSKLQTVIKELSRFNTAVYNYKTEYNAFPGDHARAEEYFTNCSDIGINFCNGNGDGYVIEWTTEALRFWQHLALSKIISGKYTGDYVNGDDLERKVNIPPAFAENGAYSFGFNDIDVKHMFRLGLIKSVEIPPLSGTFIDVNLGGIYNPEDVYYIDKKTDDGEPTNGRIRADEGNPPSPIPCVNAGGEYNFTNDLSACIIRAYLE